MKANVTTSISSELFMKAKEKKLKWSEALTLGIKHLLDEPFIMDEGATYDAPTLLAQVQKLSNANTRMQKHIEELNKRIEDET